MLNYAYRNRKNAPPVVQPKLKIGRPGDKYEQEADAMADRVMQMSEPAAIQMQPMEEEEEMLQPMIQRQPEEEEEEMLQPMIQRQPEEEEEEMLQPMVQLQVEEEEELLQPKKAGNGETHHGDISKRLTESGGGGRSLPDSTNHFMSKAFGTDFSSVRIHTDTNAVGMNNQLNARAFTHGSNIYFNEGQFNPQSSSGKHLLAHELTHVQQQSGGSSIHPDIQAGFWDTVGRGWDLYWGLDDEGAYFARALMEHYALGFGTDFDVHPSERRWNTFMLGRPEIQRAMRPLLERVAVSLAASGPTEQPWIRFGSGPSYEENLTGVRLNELESMRLTLHGCHRIEVRILYDVNAIEGGHEVIFRQIRMKWVDVADMHPGTETELDSGETVDDSELTSAGSSYNIYIEFMPRERTVYHVIGGSATQVSGWPPVPGTSTPGRRG
jgi:hypothetical protein